MLPLAAVIDDQVKHFDIRIDSKCKVCFLVQILCLHGGIPSPTSCSGDFITTVNSIPVPLSEPETDSILAWEIMWNDPFSIDDNSLISIPLNVNNGFFNNSRRSTGKYFTNEALMAFLERNNFTHVIRAHEVQQVGFKVKKNINVSLVFHRVLSSIGSTQWSITHSFLFVSLLWRNE